MNDDARLERLLADALAGAAPSLAPARVRAGIKASTSRARQRPRWLALIKEPPMRLSSRVAVGSPTARLASILLATLLLAVMAGGAVLAGASLLAGPGVIVVAQDDSGDYTTITEAIAAAEDGDTVMVEPGTYSESVIIDKDITLVGDGPREDIVIEFTTDSPTVPIHVGWPVEQEVPVGVTLEDSDATIAGMTISGPSPGLAIRVDGGAPVIEAITIVLDGDPTSYSTNALAFYGASTPTVRESTWSGYVGVREGSAIRFEGNVITGGNVSLDGPAESMIIRNTLTGGATLNPSGARGSIEGNDITGGEGISIDSMSDLVVRDNVLRDIRGSQAAIAVTDGSRAHLVGNTVTASGTAVQLSADADSTVEGNRLSENQIGVWTQSAEASLLSNEITGNAIGVVVYAGSTLDGNIIRANEVGLRVVAQGNPTLTGNTICDNETNLSIVGGAKMPDTAGNEICPDAPSEPSE